MFYPDSICFECLVRPTCSKICLNYANVRDIELSELLNCDLEYQLDKIEQAHACPLCGNKKCLTLTRYYDSVIEKVKCFITLSFMCTKCKYACNLRKTDAVDDGNGKELIYMEAWISSKYGDNPQHTCETLEHDGRGILITFVELVKFIKILKLNGDRNVVVNK